MNQGFIRDHKAPLPSLARAQLGKGLAPWRTFGKPQGLALRINDLLMRANYILLRIVSSQKYIEYVLSSVLNDKLNFSPLNQEI